MMEDDSIPADVRDLLRRAQRKPVPLPPERGDRIRVSVLDRHGGPDADDPTWADAWTGTLVSLETYGLWWCIDEEDGRLFLTPWAQVVEIREEG